MDLVGCTGFFPQVCSKYYQRIMKSRDEDLTDLYAQVEHFLRSKARSTTFTAQPLRLRTAYKSFFILTDSTGREFRADQTYLSSFRDIYTNKQYRFVRLDEWELEIKFEGKRASEIDLICTAMTFHVNRIESRAITGCYLKLHLFEGVNRIENLSQECHGFLRRLAKKNLCDQSSNVAREYTSMLSFVPLPVKTSHYFDYRPWKKQGEAQEIIDPFSTLTPAGIQAMQKLRHFVTRENILKYIEHSQVSKEVLQQLQKMVLNRRRQPTPSKQQNP